MQGRHLGLPGFDLDEPGTIEFTAERALRGQALNRFALSLRSPGNRADFLAGELAYLERYGLTAEQTRLVLARDWTGLLRAGGHLQAMLKFAATVGEDLWSIGAHNAGCTREELIAATPRRVSGLPDADGRPGAAHLSEASRLPEAGSLPEAGR